MKLNLPVGEVLTTTRSVCQRLDVDPVERHVSLEIQGLVRFDTW